MDYSKYKELKITTKDRILTITINRPDDMNAVNEQLHADFSTIFLDAEYDDEIDMSFSQVQANHFVPVETSNGC